MEKPTPDGEGQRIVVVGPDGQPMGYLPAPADPAPADAAPAPDAAAHDDDDAP